MAADSEVPEDEKRLADEWKQRLARAVGEQIQLSDDLLQMTTSPLGKGDPADWTLAELLHHGCPPIPWLQGISRFARSCLRDGSMDPAIATALYHTALASALVRRGAWITSADNSVLEFALSDCLNYSWLDRDTHRLLEEARSRVQASAPPTDN